MNDSVEHLLFLLRQSHDILLALQIQNFVFVLQRQGLFLTFKQFYLLVKSANQGLEFGIEFHRLLHHHLVFDCGRDLLAAHSFLVVQSWNFLHIQRFHDSEFSFS